MGIGDRYRGRQTCSAVESFVTANVKCPACFYQGKKETKLHAAPTLLCRLVAHAWLVFFTVVPFIACYIFAGKSVTVLLAGISLIWTPVTQDRYNWCLRTQGKVSPVFCMDRTVLQWMEGALLLAFLAEMATKVEAL